MVLHLTWPIKLENPKLESISLPVIIESLFHNLDIWANCFPSTGSFAGFKFQDYSFGQWLCSDARIISSEAHVWHYPSRSLIVKSVVGSFLFLILVVWFLRIHSLAATSAFAFIESATQALLLLPPDVLFVLPFQPFNESDFALESWNEFFQRSLELSATHWPNQLPPAPIPSALRKVVGYLSTPQT